MKIYTAVVGRNADLIKSVASLYVSPDDTIADITWGKGAFWKHVKADVTGTDLYHADYKARQDFRNLTYDNETFDHCVFDPPYVHTPGVKFQKEKMYKNSKTHQAEKTTEKYHKAVVQRYRYGMAEGARVIREGGFLWVKCQDEICSGLQCWTHLEVYDIGRKLGLYGRDMFVLVQSRQPTIQHPVQKHARKNHSYLWIFQKPDKRLRKKMSTAGVY